jgi:hypothetical protein
MEDSRERRKLRRLRHPKLVHFDYLDGDKESGLVYRVVQWHRSIGDPQLVHDIIVTLESDKAILDMPVD